MDEKYFCAECGWRGNDQMCPICQMPADLLEVNEEELAGAKDSKYPDDLLTHENHDLTKDKDDDLLDEEI